MVGSSISDPPLWDGERLISEMLIESLRKSKTSRRSPKVLHTMFQFLCSKPRPWNIYIHACMAACQNRVWPFSYLRFRKFQSRVWAKRALVGGPWRSQTWFSAVFPRNRDDLEHENLQCDNGCIKHHWGYGQSAPPTRILPISGCRQQNEGHCK